MMKQILVIITFLFFALKGIAQSPIIPLYNGSDYFNTEGAYYMDIDGDLTNLIGDWEFIKGSERLKINFRKKVKQQINFPIRNKSLFRDLLYGEYLYINSHGDMIVNTLDDIDRHSNDYSKHLIYGGRIIDSNDLPKCEDCDDNERRIKISIQDPLRNYIDYEVIIRHISSEVSGIDFDQLKILIKQSDMALIPEGKPIDDRLPTNREFILNKLSN